MNNDYLRVNSKAQEENIAVSEFKNKEQQVIENPKLNFMTLLNFNKSKSGLSKFKSENLPNFKGLLAILLIQSSVTCILAFISFLMSDVTFLLFTATVASMIIPLFIILFFYNLNTAKTTNVIEVVSGIILGISFFVILNLLEVYLSNLTKYTWLQSILTTAINDTALFLGAILFIKIAKKDNLFDAILLCVCLYAGYMVMNSLDVLINSLFINVEIVAGETTFTTGAIILNDLSFKSIILEFLNTFINDVIFMSLIIGCSAIINGGVIGLNVSPLKDETYNEWSIYLLFIITVILHVGAIFPSTIILFNVILKTLSAVFLVILAILIINYYLSKIHVDSQE